MYVNQAAPSAWQSPTPVFNSAGASGFSVGAVLSRSFSTFFRHPFVFTGMILVINGPFLILFRWAENAAVAVTATAAFFVLYLLLILLIQGAIAFGVYEANRGNSVSFGGAFVKGFERIVPMSFASIFASLCYILFVAIGVIAIVAPTGFVVSAIVSLAMGLLVVFLWCYWSVMIPACVVERLGPIESMSRSAELTSGCRLKIFALYLMGFTILYIVLALTAFLPGIHPALVILEVLIDSFPTALINVMTAVIYYELRSVKEGVSIDSLANVFD